MNVPWRVFFARAPGMPRPAGIWRGEPFTSTVRCAWMWYTTCSLVSQRMPSTGCPAALVAVLASGGALGTGTPSGPVGPGAGAGLSVPSVLSEVSFDDTEPVPPWAAQPPEVAARVMPTAPRHDPPPPDRAQPAPPPPPPRFRRSGLRDFLACVLLPVPAALGHGTVPDRATRAVGGVPHGRGHGTG